MKEGQVLHTQDQAEEFGTLGFVGISRKYQGKSYPLPWKIVPPGRTQKSLVGWLGVRYSGHAFSLLPGAKWKGSFIHLCDSKGQIEDQEKEQLFYN